MSRRKTTFVVRKARQVVEVFEVSDVGSEEEALAIAATHPADPRVTRLPVELYYPVAMRARPLPVRNTRKKKP